MFYQTETRKADACKAFGLGLASVLASVKFMGLNAERERPCTKQKIL